MRIKRLDCSMEFFLFRLKGKEHHFKIIKNALPKSARVINIIPQHDRLSVWLIIESEEFEDINEMAMIPQLDPMVFEEFPKNEP